MSAVPKPDPMKNLWSILRTRAIYSAESNNAWSAYEVPDDFFTPQMVEEMRSLTRHQKVGVYWNKAEARVVLYNKTTKPPSELMVKQALTASEVKEDVEGALAKVGEYYSKARFVKPQEWNERCNQKIDDFIDKHLPGEKLWTRKLREKLARRLFVLEEPTGLCFLRTQIEKINARYLKLRDSRILVASVPTDKGRVYLYCPTDSGGMIILYGGHFLTRLQQRLYIKETDYQAAHYRFLTEQLSADTNRLVKQDHSRVTAFLPGGAALGYSGRLFADEKERAVRIVYLITFITEDMLGPEQLKLKKEAKDAFTFKHWYEAKVTRDDEGKEWSGGYERGKDEVPLVW